MTAVMALQAKNLRTHDVFFDTDSEPVGIDNWCLACISNNINDFIGPLSDTGVKIQGFGGATTSGAKLGMLVWKWEYDEGVRH